VNVFYLDTCPASSAAALHDKHVVKMVLESAQILCSVRHRAGWVAPYKPTHLNHPSVKWAGASVRHYQWVLEHFTGLLREYTYRFGKVHACAELLPTLEHLPPLVDAGFAPPPQCMPDEFKGPCPVTAYRAYYLGRKVQQSRWTRRPAPAFIPGEPQMTETAVASTSTRATGPRGPKGVDSHARLTVLVGDNPKRPGSKAHDLFKLYEGVSTVGEFLAKGGTTAAIHYDASHGFIQVEGFEPKALPERKAKPAPVEAEAAPAKKARKGKKKAAEAEAPAETADTTAVEEQM